MESITLNTIGIVQWPNDQSVTIMWPKLPVASCKIWAKTGVVNYKCLRFDDQALSIYMASLFAHLDSLVVEFGLMNWLANKKFSLFPLPSCHIAILPSCHLAKWSTISFNLTKAWEHDGLNLKWHLQPQAKITIFEHSYNDVWYDQRGRRKPTRKGRSSKWRFRMKKCWPITSFVTNNLYPPPCPCPLYFTSSVFALQSW